MKERGKVNKKGTIKSPNKDIHKTQLGVSDPNLVAKFSIQVGSKPYSQLGTGVRCKEKGCAQPVYDKKPGLCSYHRMMEAARAFEDRLRARQQPREAERIG